MPAFIRILYSALLLAVTPAAMAWNTLTPHLDLTCNQNAARLDCDYRPLAAGAIQSISASAGKQTLTVSANKPFATAGETVAILFLVDTSDPGRENVVEKNIKIIDQLLAKGQSYQRFGLASFDKDLTIEAPIGSSREQIISAARKLRATGQTTELYRNAINAVETLARVRADRKAIYLFSDGQAEDRAYFRQDVTKAAREANVVINSLGYPRSVALSVALQTMRRLSQETGGAYVEADESYKLPESFLQTPFRNIDAGGKLAVDLAPVINRDSPGTGQVTLQFARAAGIITAQVPITNPLAAPAPAHPAAAAAAAKLNPQQTPEIRIIAPPEETRDIDIWLWYGMPAALVVLIVLALIILAVTYRQLKTPKSSTSKTAPYLYKPYAYLVQQDESAKRYPITSTTWRIGRTKDNELPLNDKSVSRRHAEIQRYSNGNFVIYDVDSLNGVFVNSEPVKKKKLQEGDIIEIGDIYLRFTTQSVNYSIGEDTAIQNTRTPLAH